MKKRLLSVLLCAVMTASLIACSASTPQTTTEKAGEETATEEADPRFEKGGKQIITYYPNWNLGSKDAKAGGEVGSIAWDSVTMVNHAFLDRKSVV